MAELPNDQQQLWKPTDRLQDWPGQWPQMHAAAAAWMQTQVKLTLRNDFMLQFLQRNVNTNGLLAMQAALVSLAQLTFNLLMFPWKQEQSRLQTCTGFFVHTLSRLEAIDEVLKQMGYVAANDAYGTKEYLLQLSSGSENDNSDESDSKSEKQLRRLLIDLLNAETAVSRLLSMKFPPTTRAEILTALEGLIPQLHQETNTSVGGVAPVLPPRALRSGGQLQQQPEHYQQQLALSQQPAHSQQQPAHAQQQPAHSQQQPAHSQQQPAHSQQQPAHSQQQNSRPAAKLAYQKNSPSGGIQGSSARMARPPASMSLKESSV